jgi:hypothetical protein
MKNDNIMPKKFKNSMQETIRTFQAWLSENIDEYREEFENAAYLFWGNRRDLPPLERNDDTEMFFNEWLMLDFSVPGYDKIPAKGRYNFLDCFLKEKGSDLSSGAKVFAKNASKSNVGFYRVLKVNRGKNTKLLDLFGSKEITVWDVNLSKVATEGIVVYGRYSKDERGKYIGSGSHGGFLTEPMFEIIRQIILETYRGTNKGWAKMSLHEFLKWNSYVYYRDIMGSWDMFIEQ